SLSCYAGQLSLRGGMERIEFVTNTNENIVEVVSYTSSLSDMTIKGTRITKRAVIDDMNAYALTSGVARDQGGMGDDVLGPFSLIAYPVTAVADTAILLIVKLPSRLFQQLRNNNDFSKLRKAIETDREVVVGQARFQRIVELLKETSITQGR